MSACCCCWVCPLPPRAARAAHAVVAPASLPHLPPRADEQRGVQRAPTGGDRPRGPGRGRGSAAPHSTAPHRKMSPSPPLPTHAATGRGATAEPRRAGGACEPQPGVPRTRQRAVPCGQPRRRGAARGRPRTAAGLHGRAEWTVDGGVDEPLHAPARAPATYPLPPTQCALPEAVVAASGRTERLECARKYTATVAERRLMRDQWLTRQHHSWHRGAGRPCSRVGRAPLAYPPRPSEAALALPKPCFQGGAPGRGRWLHGHRPAPTRPRTGRSRRRFTSRYLTADRAHPQRPHGPAGEQPEQAASAPALLARLHVLRAEECPRGAGMG